MMTRNQRLGFLGIAAAIAVIAVVLLTAGGGDSDDSGEQAAQPAATATATATGEDQQASPQETETPTPTPTPRPRPPLIEAGSVKTLTFDEGETARFRVRSDVDEEIHVHGYDRYVDVPAGETVNVSFRADITGIFEIELHGTGEQIAELKVEP